MNENIKRYLGWLLFISLVIFSIMMLNITAKYISFGDDVAFLQIKQTEVQTISYYLLIFYVHVFSSILCLPAGFTQFNNQFLKKKKYWHRALGYIYVLSVLIFAAPSGFIIGMYANGGLISIIFFCSLALLWFGFTIQALLKAKQKDWKSHQYFMMRSYALALSAITLRLYKVIIVKVWAPPPMDVYILISGLSWIPNLIFTEWLIKRKKLKQKQIITIKKTS